MINPILIQLGVKEDTEWVDLQDHTANDFIDQYEEELEEILLKFLDYLGDTMFPITISSFNLQPTLTRLCRFLFSLGYIKGRSVARETGEAVDSVDDMLREVK